MISGSMRPQRFNVAYTKLRLIQVIGSTSRIVAHAKASGTQG